MSDDLDVLFDSGGSTEPDPRFRQQLMARVRSALDDPIGGAGETPARTVDVEMHGDDRSYIDIAPRVPSGHRPGRRWVRPVFVATAASIVALVLLISFVPGGTDDQQPSVPVTSAPPTSAAPDAVATTVEDWECPNPEPSYVNYCRGVLDPGTHRTWAFDPSFTYTVPGGWSNLEDTSGNYLLLPPGADWYEYKAGASDYLGVYASIAAPAGCKEYPDPSVATTAQEYVDWLQQQASLGVSEPKPVVIGGLSGTQVDVSLSAGLVPVCSDPDIADAYAPVFIGTNGSLVTQRVLPDDLLRLNLFDRPDGALMVIVLAEVRGSDSTGDWWAAAAEITDTFQVET